jgi:stearoyl-CoA desaturase (delta-9 desaturase)
MFFGYINCFVFPLFLFCWTIWNLAEANYYAVLWCFILIELSGLHISVFVHRAWTHRAWKPTKRWLNVLAIAIYTIFFNGASIGFVANHRKHHRFEDTEKDPHSPYYMSRWAILFYPRFKMDVSYVTDLLRDKDHMFFAKNYWKINLTLWAILLLINPLYLAFWFAFIGGVGLKARFINDIGHNDPVNKCSTNTLFWAIVYLDGEPWHANHHQDPRNWRLGRKWWQIDFGNYTIWAFTKLGLGKIQSYD